MSIPSSKSLATLPSTLREVGYPDFMELNSWHRLSKQLVPPFATVFDLARQSQSQNESKPASTTEKRDGLFIALVGDPRILYYELIEDPSRFEDGVSDLILHLVAGTRQMESLTADELSLLDRAVVDWMRPRHQTSGTLQPRPVLKDSHSAMEYLSRKDALADPDVELEYSEDGRHVPILNDSPVPDMPQEAPPTFWWTKK